MVADGAGPGCRREPKFLDSRTRESEHPILSGGDAVHLDANADSNINQLADTEPDHDPKRNTKRDNLAKRNSDSHSNTHKTRGESLLAITAAALIRRYVRPGATDVKSIAPSHRQITTQAIIAKEHRT